MSKNSIQSAPCQTAVKRSLSTKNRLISKINKEFGLNIPLDYPAKTHQKAYKSQGGFCWYFKGSNTDINRYGSSFSMSELIKAKKLELFEDFGNTYEILPVYR